MEPRARLQLLTQMVGVLLLADAASGKTFETREVALQRVFGRDAAVDRRTSFLTETQIDAARAAAGASIEHARITYYVATRDDSLLGRAYLDTHRVRSLYETLLIVVEPDGRTRSVDVLAFHEPEDYLPPPRWLRQLEERQLSKRLRPGDGVDAISGATLSARAAAEAVRRVLALDRILHGEPQ
ncbi:MAG: FMN-binding protein [Candidatus Latescibacterota bacterium]|nr:MAG: FMN-binding protein [Candidatus Latescibacterota bacterium]